MQGNPKILQRQNSTKRINSEGGWRKHVSIDPIRSLALVEIWPVLTSPTSIRQTKYPLVTKAVSLSYQARIISSITHITLFSSKPAPFYHYSSFKLLTCSLKHLLFSLESFLFLGNFIHIKHGNQEINVNLKLFL